jgi:hypothetical protein
MFAYLQFRWKLWRVERWRKDAAAKFDKEIVDARKRGAKGNEIYEIESNAHHEDRMLDEDVYRLHTRYLFAEAHRLVIPTAKFHEKESWEDGPTGARHLTLAAINELRAAIRTEKKVRRELLLIWVPAIAGLTGLAGALTGLVSIWFGSGSTK